MYDVLVYVAGPITANTKNKTTRNLNAGIKQAARLWQKWRIPAFSPHAQSGQWEDWDQETDYIPTLTGDLMIIDRCDIMLLLPGWEDSPGTQIEIAYANYIGTQVFESELAMVDYIKQNYDYEELEQKAGELNKVRELLDNE
jgi:hypothetical protein